MSTAGFMVSTVDDRKSVVVLSGAGMSAESGLKTFRDSDGLWEGHKVEDVATPEAWQRNPEAVLRFYNERRRQLMRAEPNDGHLALARLEEGYEVSVITQNVDDLHERAGSSSVLHLHGELDVARSTVDDRLLYRLHGKEIRLGDVCDKGSQLRPHVVWFGESVPAMEVAEPIVRGADVLMVVGTSLLVYPAASLIDFAESAARKVWISPKESADVLPLGFEKVLKTAAIGIPDLVSDLLAEEKLD
ncbi:MAG: Sir2 family NAD-dependent protein deacetylase [Verrucomicrobiota bacterium]